MDPRRTAVLLFLLPSCLFAQTLRFVADRDYPPVTSVKDGRPAGVYVDIARAVAGELKQPFSVEVEDWSLAQSEVAGGTADVLYSVSYTNERAEKFDFSIPVTRNQFVLFTRGERHRLDTLDDLAGLRAGVTQAGLPRQLLSRLPQVATVPFSSYHDAFEALSRGTIDVFAGDLWVGAYTIVQERRQNIVPSKHVFASLAAGFAVRKGNSGLLDRLNRAITKLQVSGAVDAILDRWDPESVVIQTKSQVSASTLATTAAVLGAALVVLVLWVLILLREIRQRQTAERSKEALIRELHHRTRNNMSVISALLDLQALSADPDLVPMLKVTQNQIYVMALVHEHLYKTEDMSRIGMRAYIVELTAYVASSYGLDASRMTLRFEVDEVEVLIDVAVPLGLILNELIGNAVRHAFPPPRGGEIEVVLKSSENGLEVEVNDTGVGFPLHFDPRLHGGLGLQTVLRLAEDQLKASVAIGGPGVRFRMVFRDGLYQERVSS